MQLPANFYSTSNNAEFCLAAFAHNRLLALEWRRDAKNSGSKLARQFARESAASARGYYNDWLRFRG